MHPKMREKYKALGIEARSMTQEEARSFGVSIYCGPGLDGVSKALRKKKEQKEPNENQQPQEAQRSAELESEGWHGKHPKK